MNNMKKFAAVVLTLMTVMLLAVPAFAAELDEVKFEDNKISVSGSCNTGDQVQIAVFDYNNKPIFLATTAVDNGSFSTTLDAVFNLEAGKTYTVRVADYDGEDASDGKFTVESEKPDVTYRGEKGWKSDSKNHWHESAGGIKTGTAAHTFGDWTITKAASETEAGSKERVCTVCGYVETAVNTEVEISPNTGYAGDSLNLAFLFILSGGILTVFAAAKKRYTS